MPHFAYKSAATPRATASRASWKAPRRQHRGRAPRGSGITPVQIAESAQPAESALARQLSRLLDRQKAGFLDVLLFSRQMYTLMKAGVPIMRALAGLQESAMNRAFAAVIQDLREASIPAASCRRRWRAIPGVRPFYVAMVRVGETTGRLEEVFLRCSTTSNSRSS
jgi:MSHA biogenesis protein MshG